MKSAIAILQPTASRSAKRLHICSERFIVVALLSLWLAACNNQKPAAHGLPLPEVTVSKPKQKQVVNWNEFTGRTAAVKLVNVMARDQRLHCRYSL